jgi:hypothetical protein
MERLSRVLVLEEVTFEGGTSCVSTFDLSSMPQDEGKACFLDTSSWKMQEHEGVESDSLGNS